MVPSTAKRACANLSQASGADSRGLRSSRGDACVSRGGGPHSLGPPINPVSLSWTSDECSAGEFEALPNSIRNLQWHPLKLVIRAPTYGAGFHHLLVEMKARELEGSTSKE